jgi:hypothetical protein
VSQGGIHMELIVPAGLPLELFNTYDVVYATT